MSVKSNVVAQPRYLPSIAELLADTSRPTFSFEFFPPADEAAWDLLAQTIFDLDDTGPDWLSVTYGASGATRDRTVSATRFIKTRTIAQTMGHLTCASQSRDELLATLASYAEVDVRHVLAIRGDMSGGPTVPWLRHPEGLANATELVQLIADNFNFGIGVAAFPDPHPQSRDADLDAQLLLAKQQAGATFAVTQLFFDADAYLRLVDRTRAIGCTLPIVAGIQPVTNIAQIERFAALSGAALPERVVQRLQQVAHDPAEVRRVGVEMATELSVKVLRGGAPGLQFFTLNRSSATRAILANLRRLGLYQSSPAVGSDG